MSTENSSPEFEKLQQLLKLKQYEVPPPRYFNDFSTQVTARLRAGEGQLTVGKISWWQQLWENLGSKPAISGALVATACGLLVAGIFWSGATPTQFPGMAQNENPGTGAELPRLNPEASAIIAGTIPGLAPAASSTNPVMVSPGGSLFDLSPSIQTAPASGRPIPVSPR
jgi:hypothetical protein